MLIAGFSLRAQSLDVKHPTALRAGLNKGSVDSSAGEQYWYFMAEPGQFRVVCSPGGKALAAAAFAPSNAHGKITFQESHHATVMEGSTEQRWKVVVVVAPQKRPPAKQKTDYTLVVSGNASFGQAPIVGTYMAKEASMGAVKFLPDGSVISSTGQSGTWKLFDADMGIYSVVLSGSSMTLTLAPGRGLVDTGNKNLVFELQK